MALALTHRRCWSPPTHWLLPPRLLPPPLQLKYTVKKLEQIIYELAISAHGGVVVPKSGEPEPMEEGAGEGGEVGAGGGGGEEGGRGGKRGRF